jgi:hypothetical protein
MVQGQSRQKKVSKALSQQIGWAVMAHAYIYRYMRGIGRRTVVPDWTPAKTLSKK